MFCKTMCIACNVAEKFLQMVRKQQSNSKEIEKEEKNITRKSDSAAE